MNEWMKFLISWNSIWYSYPCEVPLNNHQHMLFLNETISKILCSYKTVIEYKICKAEAQSYHRLSQNFPKSIVAETPKLFHASASYHEGEGQTALPKLEHPNDFRPPDLLNFPARFGSFNFDPIIFWKVRLIIIRVLLCCNRKFSHFSTRCESSVAATF